MKIYFATDHSGFALKNNLLEYVRDTLGLEVEDCGAYEFNETDDYPDYVHKVAEAVSKDSKNSRGIIIGASGQGEAMVANRYAGVRAVVYYGETSRKQVDANGVSLDMIESTKVHNNANILSLGARFIDEEKIKDIIKRWLEIPFPNGERHVRRIEKIDKV